MKPKRGKPVWPRELANRDVDEAIAHYSSEGAQQAALGFIDALEQAYVHIGRHPATGSSRYAHELNLPGLDARARPALKNLLEITRQRESSRRYSPGQKRRRRRSSSGSAGVLPQQRGLCGFVLAA